MTRPGDLWCLGDHRILCGNARSEADIARLLDGQLVALVFTDPPYGVPINGHVSSSGRHPEFHEGSGEMSSKQMEDFLAITIGNAASILVVGGLVYIFMDWRHLDELSAALKRCALEHIQTCVWAKEHPGMGSFYRSQHEHVYIARKPGATHRNNIELGAHGRNRSNLWQFAGATGGRADDADDFTVHPTVKPVKLIEEAILDVTMAGETVFDPFLGSGSTLLAAERTQRRCFGLEVSAVYVDLAIRRWQAMTGKAAVHAQTGTPFDRLLQQETEPEPPIEEDF
ncbi:DNA-methyltransferase [Ovoidimarina sediminis]|uniref:DNA-methyltransferase n=1 Tax=Ovoidimarina sediminis TaxID=3079856 RepID=UPI002906C704|nr:site-specific DNA-methyltransferase [Rhodophyticola sp. MJ-SS7]MDU8946605.1 site-specific DNA-methyltransferase [Rhodophyticola sp. MJ-SS7]